MTIFSFGDFRFDAATGELSGNQTTTVLRPQVNKLLHLFISNQDQMLSKEKIMQTIWQNEHVDENAFFQCMNHLRKELGDSAKDPRFIKNFPRKGYRWIAETNTRPNAPKATAVTVLAWPRVATAAFIIFATGFGYSLLRQPLNSEDHGAVIPKPATQKKVHLSPEISLFELNHLAKETAAEGDIRQCKQVLYQMAGLAEAQLDPATQVNALNNLTHIYRFQDPRKGLPLAQRALEMARLLQIDSHLLRSHLEKGFLHLELGQYESAEKHLQQAQSYRQGTRKWFVAELHYAQGILALKTGRHEDADQKLQHMKRTLPRGPNGRLLAWSQLLEAALFLEKGVPAKAKFFAKEAWHGFQTRSSPLFAAKAALLIGQGEARSGNYAKADEWYRQSFDLCESQNLAYWQAKTAWSWAIALGKQGQVNQAQTYRKLAKNLLKSTFPTPERRQWDGETQPHFFL